MKASQLLSMIALIFFSSLSFSENSKTCPKIISEQMPFIYEGCSGEACGYLKYYKAIRKTELYAEPKENSKIISHLEMCSDIKDAKFFTSITTAGSGVVVSALGSGKDLKIGQSLKVIRSLGEGYWDVCSNDGKIFTATNVPTPPEIEFKLIEQPKTQDWIRLKSNQGAVGYAKDGYPRFFMGYYDLEPDGFCAEDHPLGPSIDVSKSQLSTFITTALKVTCSKYGGCKRSDPTQECPIDLEVWNMLSSQLKKYPRLIQCAGFGGGHSCTSDWSGSFSCTYKRPAALNQDAVNQTVFQYSCKRSVNDYSCKLN